MRINDINIKNFRQIKDKEYKFKEGINIIKGFNEEGKSTLFEAIITSLFENPKKISKRVLENIKSWDSDKYPILEYTVLKDNKIFSILKDFDKKNLTLNGDDKYNDQDFIKDSLFLDKDTFLKVSVVKQNQVSSIQGNMGSFQKSLFEILSTSSNGNVNIVDLISSLDKKVRSMRLGLDNKRSANEGILKKLERETTDLGREISQLEEDYKKEENAYQKILDKKEKQKLLNDETSKLKEEIEMVERAKLYLWK